MNLQYKSHSLKFALQVHIVNDVLELQNKIKIFNFVFT